MAPVGLVVHPVIARDVAVPVGPQQGNQVDPLNDRVVLAGPVPGNQLDGPGVWLIQRRVIDHEHTVGAPNLGFGFRPQGGGVGLQRVNSRVNASWAGASGS